MKKKKSNIVLNILLVLLLIAVGFQAKGVYATWVFTSAPVASVQGSMSILLPKWDSLDAIPNTDDGIKHEETIGKVTDGPNGLNTPGSFINTQITDRLNEGKDSYGSYDWYTGADAEKHFGSTDGKMNFMIEAPADKPNNRFLYTTTVDIGSGGSIFLKPTWNIPQGEYVYPVYKTTLTKDANGKWIQEKIEIGSAKTNLYDNNIAGSGIVKRPAFDPKSFVPGKKGLTKQDAVYAYVGQTTAAILNNNTEKAYYKVKPSSAITITLTITETEGNCIGKVYTASNMKPVKVSSGAQGSNNLSWQAKANTEYIIELTGNKVISFNLK